MPEAHIPCPDASCLGEIKVDNSGKLLMDDATGLLVRQCYVHCDTCGRKGKMLVTLDIALYLDEKPPHAVLRVEVAA